MPPLAGRLPPVEPKWQRHEREVADILGLRRTITSGNKWYDPGDGTSRGRFPLYVDCKCTEKGSFSLKLDTLNDLQFRAAEMGRRLILPVRFHPDVGPQDYVVIGLHDFAELLDLIDQEN